jgi:hypothetical protein
VELVTHHASVQNILNELQKLDFRIVVVHLVDSHHCSDAAKFISIAMLCLSTMMRLGFSHINVLSKVDLVEKHGPLAYNLDFYTEVQDLAYLIDHVEDWRLDGDDSVQEVEDTEEGGQGEGAGAGVGAGSSKASGMSRHFRQKYRRLNEAMCELVEDFSLVGFSTLNISDPESVSNLLQQVDKANGYVFGSQDVGRIVSKDPFGFGAERAVYQAQEDYTSAFNPDADDLLAEQAGVLQEFVRESKATEQM